jgi:hypothetical protein
MTKAIERIWPHKKEEDMKTQFGIYLGPFDGYFGPFGV